MNPELVNGYLVSMSLKNWFNDERSGSELASGKEIKFYNTRTTIIRLSRYGSSLFPCLRELGVVSGWGLERNDEDIAK